MSAHKSPKPAAHHKAAAKATSKTAHKTAPKPATPPAKAERHRPVLVAFVVVVVLVAFSFTMIKIVHASRVTSYKGCLKAEGRKILDTNPPICLLPDGRSFGWQI